MASEITLEDLQKKQDELMKMVAGIENETDGARIAALAPALQAKGEELEALARRFEAQMEAKFGPRAAGMTEVVLTEEQRERIRARTGITLETILIPDEAGLAAQTMPTTDPRVIEEQALVEAERRKAAAEADAQMRAQYEVVARTLEQAGHGERLAELRRDPKFLGGMFQPKK